MKYNDYQGKTLEELFELLENSSVQKSDGHITIMRFTGGGWKVFYGTPVLDGRGRDQVYEQIDHKDIKSGVISLLNNPQNEVT